MIIHGKQLLLHLMKFHSEKIVKIYLAKECEPQIFRQISRLNKPILRIDNKKAQALAHGGNHQGFLVEISDFEFCDFKKIKEMQNIAIFWGISDVGNIGSMIRTAYALGMDGAVIIAKNLAIEGILRTSSGAGFELPICLKNDGFDVINELKQARFGICATGAKFKDINEIKFGKKTALIMGSEGDGLPKKVFEKADFCVGIEMKNSFNSLNVSVAFGIICNRILNERK